MDQVYERQFRSLLGQTNVRNCFELGVPYMGELHKLIVKQVGSQSGTLHPFVVELFNSENPCRANSFSSGGNDPDGVYEGSPELYRVIDQMQSDSSGVAQFFLGMDSGIAYRNVDGSFSLPQRKLWLQITPDARDGSDNPIDEDVSYDVSILVTTFGGQ